jgi:hypothetical protein
MRRLTLVWEESAGGGAEGVGVGSGDCEVTTGVAVIVDAIECWVLVGTGDLTGVDVGSSGSSSPGSVAVGVRGTVCVGPGARRDVDMLLQAYDDSEQQEQMMQAMKKRITWSVSQETDGSSPVGSTICSAPSRRRDMPIPPLRLLRLLTSLVLWSFL